MERSPLAQRRLVEALGIRGSGAWRVDVVQRVGACDAMQRAKRHRSGVRHRASWAYRRPDFVRGHLLWRHAYRRGWLLVDERCAGRGYAPMAVTLLADWAMFDPSGPQLHRVEIDLLPENERSRKVALKVGASYEGMRKAYMFVNGQWRDHESYALLPEYAPNGFTARLMGE